MASYRHIRRWLLVIIAFVSGSLLTYVLVLTPHARTLNSPILYNLRGLRLSPATNDSMVNFLWRESIRNYNISLKPKTDGSNGKEKDNYIKRVKVLCWIMTSPNTLLLKALHVKNTWGSRCDRILYMSSVENSTFPAVGLNVSEGRDFLWEKTRAAFAYIYSMKYTDYFDWFLKADDDTYVIVENLKYFLRDKNASVPLYYGHPFTPYVPNGYMSGGAGYVLSRTAVEKFVKVGLQNDQLCPKKGNLAKAEDLSMGLCMQNVGVIAGDSRDSLNRSRFLPFRVSDIMKDDYIPEWYIKYARHQLQSGLKCCSDYLISCHYVSPHEMYAMDYFVYHLRPALHDSDHTYLSNRTRLPI